MPIFAHIELIALRIYSVDRNDEYPKNKLSRVRKKNNNDQTEMSKNKRIQKRERID